MAINSNVRVAKMKIILPLGDLSYEIEIRWWFASPQKWGKE